MTDPKRRRSRALNGTSSIYQTKDGRWHGLVSGGVRADGSPDRRHVQAKSRAEVTQKVRELEKLRDAGTLTEASESWTVASWLEHWLANIAAPVVRPPTLAGYRAIVRKHLIPEIGSHQLTELRPEHLAHLYVRMVENGSRLTTASSAHRTMRAALDVAAREGHLSWNPARSVEAPKGGQQR